MWSKGTIKCLHISKMGFKYIFVFFVLMNLPTLSSISLFQIRGSSISNKRSEIKIALFIPNAMNLRFFLKNFISIISAITIIIVIITNIIIKNAVPKNWSMSSKKYTIIYPKIEHAIISPMIKPKPK